MSSATTPTASKFLRALALYNVIGGSIGLVAVALTSLMAWRNVIFPWAAPYFVIAYALSMGSYVAFRKHGTPIWLGVYAILQLPVVTYAGLKYSLNNGLLLIVGCKAPTILAFQFELYDIKFDFSLENQDPAFGGVNVVSVATLFYLFFVYQSSNHPRLTAKATRQEDSIKSESQG